MMDAVGGLLWGTQTLVFLYHMLEGNSRWRSLGSKTQTSKRYTTLSRCLYFPRFVSHYSKSVKRSKVTGCTAENRNTSRGPCWQEEASDLCAGGGWIRLYSS